MDAVFDAALLRPVTTVIAGPGYGKSVSVYTYLRETLKESETRALWVQLSANDVMTSHFWETFTQAIEPLNPRLAAAVSNLGFPASEEMRRYLAELFRNELKSRYRYILVLDDLYLLEDGPVLDFIARLLDSLSSGVCAIVLSRHDNLPNSSELLRDKRLSRIDENELSFTKSEIREYFASVGIVVDNEVVEDIYCETEGMPIAVSFAARLLERRPDDSAYVRAALRGNFKRIIENEFFSVISEERRAFLLRLSLLRHLSPELITELGGGQETMRELADASSLIRFDHYMHVYRIHHLLLQYLTEKQNLLTEEQCREVYGKAARWCDANGYRVDALSYYRAMGDFDAIVNVAFSYPLVMPIDIASELLDALEQAPAGFFDTNPGARVLHTRLIMTLGRIEESIELVYEYIALLEQRPPSAGNNRTLMGLHNNLGYAKMITCPETHDYSFFEHFRDALEYAESAARAPASGFLIFSVGSYALRVGNAQAGGPEACIEAVRQSIPCTTITLRGCMYGLDSLMRSEYAYFRGLPDETERYALRCVRQAHEFGQVETEIRALYLLIRAYLQTGKYERIMEVFAQLDILMGEKSFMNRHLLNEIVTSWFFAMIGEVSRVESWLKSDLWSSGLNSLIEGPDDFTKVKYYLAIKDYQTLLAFADDRAARFGVMRFLIGQVGFAAVRAVCHLRLGNRAQALEWLGEAYELSRPNELIMPLIELGNNMRSLANAALKAEVAGIPTEWLETIRSRATTYAKRVAHVRSRYLETHGLTAEVQLTQRELAILQDLSHGLSRTEISLAHGVSVNTVKSMLQMIYQKLGAESALDAIRVATTKHLM
ncbi:MAG: LuxR C-terminal-related transcriptional regulator [Coriobacteriales bacterium]|jgi:LuxR family maltose regulon positive regulatory protein|nr:LuxR C-terminal-related transcriptional regulator [Coriobacteriales bacterium]